MGQGRCCRACRRNHWGRLGPSLHHRIQRSGRSLRSPRYRIPLTDLGPARTSQSVTISGLSRELIVNGGDTIKVLRTIGGPVGGPTAAEQVCVTFESSGFCPSDIVVGGIPETFGDSGDGGMSSSDGVNWTPIRGFNGTVWTEVPTDATYVSFIAGSRLYWQRPVAGLAIFPFSAGDFVAYSSDGRLLRRVAFPLAASGLSDGPQRIYDYSDEQVVELRLLTEDSTAGCLKAHGAAIAAGSNVAVFDPNADERQIWDGCVIETKRVVSQRVTGMNVHSYDPPQVRGG